MEHVGLKPVSVLDAGPAGGDLIHHTMMVLKQYYLQWYYLKVVKVTHQCRDTGESYGKTFVPASLMLSAVKCDSISPSFTCFLPALAKEESYLGKREICCRTGFSRLAPLGGSIFYLIKTLHQSLMMTF